MTWFHLDARPHDVAVLRIATFGIWAALSLLVPLANAAELPSWIFTFRGLLSVLPAGAMQEPVVLWGLRVAVLLGSLTCAAGGRSYRFLAVPTALALLLFHGVMTSIGGYVNHAQLAPLYTAAILAVQPSVGLARLGDMSKASSATPDVAQHPVASRAPFAMASVGLVLALAYSLLALRRLTNGGLGIYLDGTTGITTIARSLEYGETSFRVGSLIEGSPPLLAMVAVGFLISTVFEFLAPLALLDTWFRRVWVIYMVGFHLSTIVMMNIPFVENLLLIVVVFTHALRPRWAAGDKPDDETSAKSSTG